MAKKKRRIGKASENKSRGIGQKKAGEVENKTALRVISCEPGVFDVLVSK